MKRLIYLSILLLMLGNKLQAQETGFIQADFIRLVDQNSLLLKAYHDQVEAAKIGAKVGINPSNPEARYTKVKNGDNYNEEIEINQSLDFPMVYAKRNKMAGIERERLNSNFQAFRQGMMVQAFTALQDYAYAQKAVDLNKERLERAQKVYDLMQKRFDTGDISAIELSKAKMELILLVGKMKQAELALSGNQKELALYTGEIPVADLEVIMAKQSIVRLSESQRSELQSSWMTRHQDVVATAYKTQLSEQQIALKKAEALPKLVVGYRRDKNDVMSMNGAVAGITIPLWEKRHTVKQAKAERLYAESNSAEARLRAQVEFEQAFQSAKQNQALYENLQEGMLSVGALDQLKKSLEIGYISLLEYYNQIKVYYTMEDELLQARKVYYIVCGELYRYQI